MVVSEFNEPATKLELGSTPLTRVGERTHECARGHRSPSRGRNGTTQDADAITWSRKPDADKYEPD